MKFFIKDFFVNELKKLLKKFTEEILYGKLYLLCSEIDLEL